MKISDERLIEISFNTVFHRDVFSAREEEIEAIAEELQALRKKLIWHPVKDGIENECDVFLINLDGTDELATVHCVIDLQGSYEIDGVQNQRDGRYFGRWDFGDILEDFPNATWRDIVTKGDD